MKIVDGLTAYDILKLPGCPIKLPVARSMTQARIDFESREAQIINWYKQATEGKQEGGGHEKR